MNHQLERAGVPTRIQNFTSDIKDSEAYTHLLHQVCGHLGSLAFLLAQLSPLWEPTLGSGILILILPQSCSFPPLQQIAGPDAGVSKEPLMTADLLERAELMLQQADR